MVVREKKPLETLADTSKILAQAEAELKPLGGRAFLRYSGTEPKVRLLLEGPDAAVLQQWNQKISSVLKKELE
jgi:phosphoglucosamine mutase